MEELCILNIGGWISSYMNDEPAKGVKCAKCNDIIEKEYNEIIDKLKENKLLDNSYKKMCCFCHLMACVGTDIPDIIKVGEFSYIKFINNWYPIENDEGDKIENTARVRFSYYNINSSEVERELIFNIYDVRHQIKTGRIIE